eukprot:m.66203 g.66203  ORF g.66203 m.66203 type:complete len:444 (-) comp11789_c0_seq2:1115-2446(-)
MEILSFLFFALAGVVGSFIPIALVLIYIAAKKSGLPSPVSKGTAEFLTVFILWNTYLVGYATFLWPLFMAECLKPTFSFASIASQYFVFVTFGPSPFIIFSGVAKALSIRSGGWNIGHTLVVSGLSVAITLRTLALYYVPNDEEIMRDFYCLAIMYTTYYVYQATTSIGNPEVNGQRKWDFVLNANSLWGLAHGYLNFRIIHDGECRDPKATKLFGYHPHSIIPYCCGLTFLHKDWQKIYPFPVFMVDALIHQIPLMKDGIQWLNCREVSKQSVRKALKDRMSALLVPGGQAEILYSRSTSTEVHVLRHRKGFIRLAMENNADVVPMFCFGEWELLDNIELPIIQSATKKLLGFPMPFYPFGRLFLPIPRRPPHGVTVIIGETIKTPKLEGGSVKEKDLNHIHGLYFDAVQRMFDKYKIEAGYPHKRLVWIDEDSSGKHEKNS